ncbi:helix-turn-helix domain-containing protein [Variovorax paradoxus]|jgi:transcriptional regulator with XRE-family HTH domain|uniref:helix-turn-helix domain-containing protein n=1 Tax=Variovorax paradoxus TaxID=34073 RepID=UPI0039925901
MRNTYKNGIWHPLIRSRIRKMAFGLALATEILQALGQRIRAQRLAQELPQLELAQMAGLSLGALRKLESSGQSSLETLVRTVYALGLVDELEDLFVLKRQTIAQMAQAEALGQRRRATRRRRGSS